MHARVLLALFAVGTLVAGSGLAYPTPGLNGETTEQIPVVGRLFPEPLMTNDYIGYFEASESLRILNETYPDRVELFKAADSYGWVNQNTGQRESNPVWLIEVTNEESEVAFDDKIQLFFMCSIHGNEKGGREGCMRVVEDFAKGIGMADGEHVGLLDYMTLVFILMNTDGWTHDEPQYYGPGGTMYTRQNANGTDMNRNWPTMGRMAEDQSHKTLAEPETAGAANFVQDRYNNVWFASDIHGMLYPADVTTRGAPPGAPEGCINGENPDHCIGFGSEAADWLINNQDKGHFLLGLLPAGQLTQLEQVRMTSLSELVKERVNEACGGGPLAQTWCLVPSTGAWGGTYNEWGTVWETINYQVSGGSHDWMLSDHGLNAPSLSFEMSYNHITCDGVYTGCGQYMNDFHVNTVRTIVSAFMEAASMDLRVSIESGGARTGYLFNPLIATNVDENGTLKPSGGWADINGKDDRWDVLHNAYIATPNDYLRDLAGYVVDGERPGVFEEIAADALTAERLANYENFVVAGSAYNQLSADHKALLQSWVEGGGNLVLTDVALNLVADLGIVGPENVREIIQTVGYAEILDQTHELAKDTIGYSVQTYEPVPTGRPESGSSPIWVIDTSALQAPAVPDATSDIVGVVAPGNERLDESENTAFAEIHLGEGSIRILGALLPDPTYEHYSPYGVASHAVTYAGNQYFINMLGFDSTFVAPPLVLEDTGNLRKANANVAANASIDGSVDADAQGAEGGDSPSVGAFGLMLAAVAGLGFAARGRRED